jgi:hypothetical protein
MSTATPSKQEIKELEQALSFTTDKPIVYGELAKRKPRIRKVNLLQGGLVQTTTIDNNNTKTTSTRLETNEEKLLNLQKMLYFSGVLK